MHTLPISIPQNNHISVAFYHLSGKFLTFLAIHEVILSFCTWLNFCKISFPFPLLLHISVSQFLSIIASGPFLSVWRWCPRCVNHISSFSVFKQNAHSFLNAVHQKLYKTFSVWIQPSQLWDRYQQLVNDYEETQLPNITYLLEPTNKLNRK